MVFFSNLNVAFSEAFAKQSWQFKSTHTKLLFLICIIIPLNFSIISGIDLMGNHLRNSCISEPLLSLKSPANTAWAYSPVFSSILSIILRSKVIIAALLAAVGLSIGIYYYLRLGGIYVGSTLIEDVFREVRPNAGYAPSRGPSPEYLEYLHRRVFTSPPTVSDKLPEKLYPVDSLYSSELGIIFEWQSGVGWVCRNGLRYMSWDPVKGQYFWHHPEIGMRSPLLSEDHRQESLEQLKKELANWRTSIIAPEMRPEPESVQAKARANAVKFLQDTFPQFSWDIIPNTRKASNIETEGVISFPSWLENSSESTAKFSSTASAGEGSTVHPGAPDAFATVGEVASSKESVASNQITSSRRIGAAAYLAQAESVHPVAVAQSSEVSSISAESSLPAWPPIPQGSEDAGRQLR